MIKIDRSLLETLARKRTEVGGQGFLFGRPVTPHELRAGLRNDDDRLSPVS